MSFASITACTPNIRTDRPDQVVWPRVKLMLSGQTEEVLLRRSVWVTIPGHVFFFLYKIYVVGTYISLYNISFLFLYQHMFVGIVTLPGFSKTGVKICHYSDWLIKILEKGMTSNEDVQIHYENTPIQIYWKFDHQTMKIFR